MPVATQIDVPHSLGRDEARRRLKARIGELSRHIPGGMADVQASWPAEDRMDLTVAALGQTVRGNLLVEESRIHVELMLPPMLAFMGGVIADAMRDKGGKLLLGPPNKPGS